MCAKGLAAETWRKPTSGTAAFCARTGRSHIAAPEERVMKSRRSIASPEAHDKTPYQVEPVMSALGKSRHMRRKTACPFCPESDIKCDIWDRLLRAKRRHSTSRSISPPL